VANGAEEAEEIFQTVLTGIFVLISFDDIYSCVIRQRNAAENPRERICALPQRID
jgi:hypothetical protein